MKTNDTENELATAVLDAAFKVHSSLVPGLAASAYRECLFYELSKSNLHIQKDVPLQLVYKEEKLGNEYKADLVVEGKLVVQVKSVDVLTDFHLAEIRTYQKLADCKIGLLINFNVVHLKDGIRKIVNGRIDDPFNTNP